MALGTIAGALASSATSFGLGKLFGGGKKDTRVAAPSVPAGSFPSLSAGGLRATAAGDRVSVTPTVGRTQLINALQGASFGQANDLSALRGRVAPGFSDLRKSRLAQIDDARRRSIGNLRENLQRRRVLGSSFAGDALNRAEAEFARESDRVASETFLQELELTTNLINQETQARTNAFNVRLSELNLQADLGAKIASAISSDINQNARLQAQLAVNAGTSNAELSARESAGAGQFFGQVGDAIGGGINDFFGKRAIGNSLAASTTVT